MFPLHLLPVICPMHQTWTLIVPVILSQLVNLHWDYYCMRHKLLKGWFGCVRLPIWCVLSAFGDLLRKAAESCNRRDSMTAGSVPRPDSFMNGTYNTNQKFPSASHWHQFRVFDHNFYKEKINNETISFRIICPPSCC